MLHSSLKVSRIYSHLGDNINLSIYNGISRDKINN